MIRRVIFLSAALLCGSVSIANSSPATLVAGCTAGSCDALVIAEIAALGRLPAAQKDAQIDLLLAALASVQPTSPAVKAAISRAIGTIGASYTSPERRVAVANLQAAFNQKQVATAAVNPVAVTPTNLNTTPTNTTTTQSNVNQRQDRSSSPT